MSSAVRQLCFNALLGARIGEASNPGPVSVVHNWASSVPVGAIDFTGAAQAKIQVSFLPFSGEAGSAQVHDQAGALQVRGQAGFPQRSGVTRVSLLAHHGSLSASNVPRGLTGEAGAAQAQGEGQAIAWRCK